MVFDDPIYLRSKQYKTADNLTARVNLHKAFSANKYGWCHWVFDQLDLPPRVRILEIGCGRGDLWQENMTGIPAGWDIILSDFSQGMLTETRANLANLPARFNFGQIDIRSIPFRANEFDAVIANHMLYHVPERATALREVTRVLKPDGVFCTTTIGERHMAELTQLVREFGGEDMHYDFDSRRLDFLLENGTVQLEPFFEDIEMRRYEDTLIVTEVGPLENYVESGRFKSIVKEQENEFHNFLRDRMKEHGAIHIFKDSGIFICKKKRASGL